MRFLEKVGKNIDDAITEALIELGVTRDEVTIDVLEKGSKGFLGIGAKLAKVRVTVNEEVETTKDLERTILEEEIKIADKKAIIETLEEIVVEPIKPKKVEAKTNQVKDNQVKKSHIDKKAQAESKLILASQEAKIFLDNVLKEMQIEGNVETEIKNDKVLINISGNKMGLIIGKRGETLDSLQYLTNIVVNKGNDDYVKVMLDTENYRLRREETLQKVAMKFAKKATQLKKPVALEPMNPYDRRIIHSVLQNSKSVKTHSEGREPFRKVVISPVGYNKNYKR